MVPLLRCTTRLDNSVTWWQVAYIHRVLGISVDAVLGWYSAGVAQIFNRCRIVVLNETSVRHRSTGLTGVT